MRAELRQAVDEGVAGVIARVVGLITGAASEGGFKGLAGRFGRQGLLRQAHSEPSLSWTLPARKAEAASQLNPGPEHFSGIRHATTPR